MIATIGPFWDANETWLVLGVGILLMAFPLAHGVILGALYLPVAFMLVGPDAARRGLRLPRQGARRRTSRCGTALFYAGSLLASLAQGYMLGSLITGFRRRLVDHAVHAADRRVPGGAPTACWAPAG